MAKKKPGSTPLKNPKQELFAWLYAGYHNRDLFGNGTRCYMQAYGHNDTELKLQEEIMRLEAGTLGPDGIRVREKGYTSMVEILEAKIKSLTRFSAVNANYNLARKGVRERVDYLIDNYITNEHTDRELQFVILQRKDLQSKVQAIKEFNTIKERTKSKLEGNISISWESDEPRPAGRPSSKKKTVPVVAKNSVDVEWESEDDEK